MRVLFLNRYYWPEVAATAQQLHDLASALAEAGHQVDVLCSAGRYRGGEARAHEDGAHRRDDEPHPREDEHEGVRIHRLRSFARGGDSLPRRLLDYAAFHLQAAAWLLRHGRQATVLVSLTDPPALGLHGLWLRLLTRGRVASVCWSMDLLSEAAQALGLLRPGGLPARLASAMELFPLRRADAVVALGPCMARRLESSGLRPERLHVITPWADGEEIPATTAPGAAALREELGLDGRFIVMYSGNAGRVHDFESTMAAMERLRHDERLHFVFAGGGPRFEDLRRFAHERGIANATFLPYFPRTRLGEALALADAHLVTLRRGLEGVVVPCKLYGALAAARPVLVVAPSGSCVSLQVRAAGAGLCLAPEDAEGLVEAMLRLSREPELAAAMGRRGRDLFEREHEKRVCTRQWQALLSLTAAAAHPKARDRPS